MISVRKITLGLMLLAAFALIAGCPKPQTEEATPVPTQAGPTEPGPQAEPTFLVLMNRLSQAWLRDGITVQIRQLDWSDDRLRLLVEAPGLEMLQQAEASLVAEALSVSSGTATAEGGSARAELVVRP